MTSCTKIRAMSRSRWVTNSCVYLSCPLEGSDACYISSILYHLCQQIFVQENRKARAIEQFLNKLPHREKVSGFLFCSSPFLHLSFRVLGDLNKTWWKLEPPQCKRSFEMDTLEIYELPSYIPKTIPSGPVDPQLFRCHSRKFHNIAFLRRYTQS